MASQAAFTHVATAEQVEASEITRVIRAVNSQFCLSLAGYWDLHAWTIAHPNEFYNLVWDRYGVIGDKGFQPLFDESVGMTDTAKLMPRARLNYTENALLGHKNAKSKERMALISAIEPAHSDETPISDSLTWNELYDRVNFTSNALRKLGVRPCTRVCAFSANNVDSIVAALATIALGGIFSSCAADMGPGAVLDRLGQIEPRVLFTINQYLWNGRVNDMEPKLKVFLPELAKPGCRHVVITNHLGKGAVGATLGLPNVHQWSMEDLVKFGQCDAPTEIPFWRGPAMAPLWILYSSGTTGKPKALVHSAAGMIMHAKVINDIEASMTVMDTQVQSTTLGWMMWNNSVNLLLSGITVVTYDGSPLAPLGVLFDVVARTCATTIGLSPKFLDILQRRNYNPKEHYDLRTLQRVLCAGSPMRPDLYHFIFNCIKKNVFINNGSGGTDVCGAIVSGVPTEPIHAPEIQAPVLGFAVEAWNDKGKPVIGEVGTMVITKPVPNMPLGFWGEKDDKRYRSTYFADFLPQVVWNQADLIVVNPATCGITIHGRSDAVLNPNGIRFGTAELYDCVDPFVESVAVAQRFRSDERVILFVKTHGGEAPKAELVDAIRESIRTRLSRRHIPAIIIGVSDIPYNGSGKKLEVAVRKLVNGTKREAVDTSACVNPECLSDYRPDRPELQLARAKL